MSTAPPDLGPPAPLPLERLALGVLIACVAVVMTVRVSDIDTPWHLATARMAWEGPGWPTSNTFSWAQPDAPLNHCYPLYQSLLWVVYQAGGWVGLSLLGSALWLLALGLWVQWGGGWRVAALASPLWCVPVYVCYMRRLLRPEMLTVVWLACLLLAFERYRRGGRWWAAAFVPLLWAMSASHPTLYPLGVGLVLSFAIHALMARWLGGRLGIADDDAALPVWPLLLGLAGGLLACAASPLGEGIFLVPLRMLGQFEGYGGAETAELASTFANPISARVAYLGLASLALWAALSWRRWQPYEAAVLVMGLVPMLAAVRGLPFFAPVAAALAGRALARLEAPRWPGGGRALLGAAVSVAFAASLLHTWVVEPNRTLRTPQSGVGLAHGQWGSATLDALRADLPPAEIFNMPWRTANPLIWGLYPERRIYVDPRFESFPAPFVLEAAEAMRSPEVLARVLARERPAVIVAGMRYGQAMRRCRELIASGGWRPTHCCAQLLVLARADQAWGERIDLDAPAPIAGLIEAPASEDLRGMQLVRVIRALRLLGAERRAAALAPELRRLAARHPVVARQVEVEPLVKQLLRTNDE